MSYISLIQDTFTVKTLTMLCKHSSSILEKYFNYKLETFLKALCNNQCCVGQWATRTEVTVSIDWSLMCDG